MKEIKGVLDDGLSFPLRGARDSGVEFLEGPSTPSSGELLFPNNSTKLIPTTKKNPFLFVEEPINWQFHILWFKKVYIERVDSILL